MLVSDYTESTTGRRSKSWIHGASITTWPSTPTPKGVWGLQKDKQLRHTHTHTHTRTHIYISGMEVKCVSSFKFRSVVMSLGLPTLQFGSRRLSRDVDPSVSSDSGDSLPLYRFSGGLAAALSRIASSTSAALFALLPSGWRYRTLCSRTRRFRDRPSPW